MKPYTPPPLHMATRLATWPQEIPAAIPVAQLVQVILVVAILLAASIGQWVFQAVFNTSYAATVQTARVDVSDSTIADAVIEHVRQIAIEEKLFNAETDDLSVEIQHIPRAPRQFYSEENATDQPTPIAIEVESTLARQFRHQAHIRVTLTHASGERHTLGVPVRITLTKPVWVAKKQILPGENLTTTNLVKERRALTHEMTKAIAASKPLNSYVARLMVLEGDILKDHQMTVPLAVRSQGFVKILLSAPKGVRMVVEGKALEDGHIGDLIRVRNKINPDRLYTAKVVGPNRVAVTL